MGQDEMRRCRLWTACLVCRKRGDRLCCRLRVSRRQCAPSNQSTIRLAAISEGPVHDRFPKCLRSPGVPQLRSCVLVYVPDRDGKPIGAANEGIALGGEFQGLERLGAKLTREVVRDHILRWHILVNCTVNIYSDFLAIQILSGPGEGFFDSLRR